MAAVWVVVKVSLSGIRNWGAEVVLELTSGGADV
jgi:hypothetical protein